ncbi:hypothetical protein BJB45_02225 [Halomonas huangheensis]|uniref:Uncharacterized protein n=1 Tax=Halomonas huangheensis TaxID=1178482 RepID=W1N316_9GAMM|nr:hypothetical protein BJB45_02225 [Halomonas huangheensis]
MGYLVILGCLFRMMMAGEMTMFGLCWGESQAGWMQLLTRECQSVDPARRVYRA